jgi:uncharacterized membrane protein YhaH (DUF805 family)
LYRPSRRRNRKNEKLARAGLAQQSIGLLGVCSFDSIFAENAFCEAVMTARNVGRCMVHFGVFGLLGSIVWWAIAYNVDSGGKILARGLCLLSDGNNCHVMRNALAEWQTWQKELAYQPGLFWICSISLILGVAVLNIPKDIFFSTSGRGGRKEYWLVISFWIVVCLASIGLIDFVDFLLPQQEYHTIDSQAGKIVVWLGAPSWIRNILKSLNLLLLLVALTSTMTISLRRLHDRGRSAWWLLPMYLLTPWAIIELGLLPGGEEANSYGPAKIVKEWN